MRHRRATTRLLGVALVLSGFAGSGHAQYGPRDHDGLPYNNVQRTGGIEYVAGGIGFEAEERLRKFAKERGYNLELLFTLNSGNYVADVDVAVTGKAGWMLVRAVADGPYLFAKMPPGSYVVTATYAGKSETRTVTVGDRGMRTEHFRWPVNPETDFTFGRSGYPARGTSGS